MSRIGKKPLRVPAGVKVQLDGCTVTVEGPKGKLQWQHRPEVTVRLRRRSQGPPRPAAASDDRAGRALHGLTRALLQNMIVGVTQGYEKRWKSSAWATWPPS